MAVRCRSAKVVLHIQDTTELDYSRKKSLAGTGPLSEQSRQGFFAHNEYVVQARKDYRWGCGTVDIHARNPEEHGAAQLRKQLPIEEKESYPLAGGLPARLRAQRTQCGFAGNFHERSRERHL